MSTTTPDLALEFSDVGALFDVDVINFLLQYVDLKLLAHNVELALGSGEIQEFFRPSIHRLLKVQLPCAICLKCPYTLDDMSGFKIKLLRWLLLSYSGIDCWNTFTRDAVTKLESVRGHRKYMSLDDLEFCEEIFRWTKDILTETEVFNIYGGVENIEQRALDIRAKGFSNFTLENREKLEMTPETLIAYIGFVQEKLFFTLQKQYNAEFSEPWDQESDMAEGSAQGPDIDKFLYIGRSDRRTAPDSETCSAKGHPHVGADYLGVPAWVVENEEAGERAEKQFLQGQREGRNLSKHMEKFSEKIQKTTLLIKKIIDEENNPQPRTTSKTQAKNKPMSKRRRGKLPASAYASSAQSLIGRNTPSLGSSRSVSPISLPDL